jgi:hypothetical protein
MKAHCGDRTHDLPIAMAVRLLRVGCSTNGAQRAKPSWLCDIVRQQNQPDFQNIAAHPTMISELALGTSPCSQAARA